MYAVKRNFTFFERLFIWRRMNFSEQKFILMISFVVGVLTAFAGLFLKWLIHQIQYLLTYRFDAPVPTPFIWCIPSSVFS